MVELRKRPPPKEPPAPPPAAKKRGPKSKGAAAGKGSESITDKAKDAANKVKEAITGDSNKDKQPTVEDAATPGDDAPKPMTQSRTSNTTPAIAERTGHNSGATLPTETAGGADASTVGGVGAAGAASSALGGVAGTAPTGTETAGTAAFAAPPGPAVPSNMPPSEAVKADEDPSRPQTSEALENPPETGKVEPATSMAQGAIIGGGVGPAAHPGSEGQVSTVSSTAGVPLSTDSVGKLIALEGFGGTVETHDGRKVSVKDLLGQGAAKGGLVIFTYPRASTPGCTQQACLFRDNYQPITASGLAVYGLSTDSTKANGNFVTKQSLPFPLLCDPQASLTSAIGMKKPGGGNSTTRGVVVIDGMGVVKVWFQGGPAKTLDVVMDFIKTMGK